MRSEKLWGKGKDNTFQIVGSGGLKSFGMMCHRGEDWRGEGRRAEKTMPQLKRI